MLNLISCIMSSTYIFLKLDNKSLVIFYNNIVAFYE